MVTCINKTPCLLYEDTYWKDGQTDVWKQARLSQKQNRSNAKIS